MRVEHELTEGLRDKVSLVFFFWQARIKSVSSLESPVPDPALKDRL